MTAPAEIQTYATIVPLPSERQQGSTSLEADDLTHAKSFKSYLRRHLLFICTFLVPFTLATVYYLVVTADQYETEAEFVVRSPSRASHEFPSAAEGAGVNRASEEAFAVEAFIRSRDALDLLVREADLRAILSRPEADPFWRFPNWFKSDTRESLFSTFLWFVDVTHDANTGINVVRTRAFRPEDAAQMSKVLLAGAEQLVNRINDRARRDLIESASQEVEIGKEAARQVRRKLADFRSRETLIDPLKTSNVLIETVGKLSFELAAAKVQLSQALEAAPTSPQVATVRNKITALEAQIKRERELISGGTAALAPVIAEYERLILEQDLAEKSLTSALKSLEAARMDSSRQQLYLERIVEPKPSDYPAYPKRLRSVLIALGICLAVFSIARALTVNVRAHA